MTKDQPAGFSFLASSTDCSCIPSTDWQDGQTKVTTTNGPISGPPSSRNLTAVTASLQYGQTGFVSGTVTVLMGKDSFSEFIQFNEEPIAAIELPCHPDRLSPQTPV